MTSARISSVIFDLGGVLVGVDLGRGLWSRLKDSIFKQPDFSVETLMKEDLIVQHCSGRLSSRDFHQEIQRLSGLVMSFDEFRKSWCDVFFPMPEMEKVMEKLSPKIPVGLLSDTDPLHWEYQCEHFPKIAGIPNPTLSFQIGAMKPSAQSYQAALKNLGVKDPATCLFVDDRRINVEGAQRVGMDAVQFQGADGLIRELSKRNLW